MKTLAVIANCTKPRAADVLCRIHVKAEQLGLCLLADEATAELLEAAMARPLDALFDEADAVMALGGDGTMLRTVRDLDGRDRPVMGVNIGGLGFLTSVAEEDLDRALQCLAADDLVVSEKSIAEGAILRDGREVVRCRALNEIAIWRGPSSRVVRLEVKVGPDHVTTYVCDGLIVSTPTGSTGYSLSAGGPILTPDTNAFVISLICPHTLSSRPLVVPDHSEICVTPEGNAGDMLLSADGQVDQHLQDGDCVMVNRSRRGVRFLLLPGSTYFSVLRQKLNWSGHSA